MALLGIDIGGTKIAAAVFTEEGEILSRTVTLLGERGGKAAGVPVTETAGKLKREEGAPGTETAGKLVAETVRKFLSEEQPDGSRIESIGISVPGIYRMKEGTVWAPNIPGWDNYPLLQEVEAVCTTIPVTTDKTEPPYTTIPVTTDKTEPPYTTIPVTIDSDRACYILGEMWQGNARGCRDAIFLAVGTGIGAGIMADGRILRGAHDIAGAIGWLALDRPFRDEYTSCGCFEHNASGEGIAKVARAYLKKQNEYAGVLRAKHAEEITSHDVFAAFQNGDPLASTVIKYTIEFWGMAVANLISLFNPEKIILGGGVFGPAVSLIPEITREAARWAQPISRGQVTIEASALGGDAGVYGAGYLAREKCQSRS